MRVLINFFVAVWCNNTKINMRIVYFYLQTLKGFSNLIERVLYGFLFDFFYVKLADIFVCTSMKND